MGQTKKLVFQLDLTFFGLTSKAIPTYRKNLFNQIHEICFYGQGGYDYYTVYNMPIWLRKFTYHKLEEHYSNKSKKDDDLISATEKYKNMAKIDPSQMKQFQFKGKPKGGYSKK